MADTFENFYIPPPEAGVGTAADYMGQIGGYKIGPQPDFTVPYTSLATPAQGFTATETGYTPTFDFSSYMPYSEQPISYAQPGGGYAFDPLANVLGLTAAQAPTAFAGQVSQPSYEALQPLYQAAMQPLPAEVRAFAQPGAADIRSGLYDTTGLTTEPTAPKKPEEGLFGKLSGADLLKLLTGGIGGLMSYQAAQKAQQDAAAARQEYQQAAQKAATDVKGLAQPYLTAGGSQLAMALQGSLGPAQLQQYQAQQARLAQEAARSGGVGAIQTAAAEQQMYQQALQNQQNMALQLLGPGNQMAYNAVMTELQGTHGGLQMEMQYGMQAAQAMAGMMSSLGYGVGSVGSQQQQRTA